MNQLEKVSWLLDLAIQELHQEPGITHLANKVEEVSVALWNRSREQ